MLTPCASPFWEAVVTTHLSSFQFSLGLADAWRLTRGFPTFQVGEQSFRLKRDAATRAGRLWEESGRGSQAKHSRQPTGGAAMRCVGGGNKTPFGEEPSSTEAWSCDITTPGERLKGSEKNKKRYQLTVLIITFFSYVFKCCLRRVKTAPSQLLESPCEFRRSISSHKHIIRNRFVPVL